MYLRNHPPGPFTANTEYVVVWIFCPAHWSVGAPLPQSGSVSDAEVLWLTVATSEHSVSSLAQSCPEIRIDNVIPSLITIWRWSFGMDRLRNDRPWSPKRQNSRYVISWYFGLPNDIWLICLRNRSHHYKRQPWTCVSLTPSHAVWAEILITWVK